MREIEQINKIINYVEEHLTEKLDLETVAHAVNYSKYHIHRIFKNTVGLTIHDYAHRRQLTEAAKLVAFSQKSIIEISLLAGYESHQAFSNAFKLIYKKTPSQFREEEIFYPLQLKYELKGTYEMLNNNNIQGTDIRFARTDDIPAWIELIRLVIDGFPYMNEKEHIKVLENNIDAKQVLILMDSEIAVAGMIFNRDTGNIGFFGVHPLYRKKEISKLFFEKLLNEMNDGNVISISTYREGDKADIGYRKEFKNLGFADAELLEEFGYPTQKLILQKGTNFKEKLQ